jgi:hypothetical protein
MASWSLKISWIKRDTALEEEERCLRIAEVVPTDRPDDRDRVRGTQMRAIAEEVEQSVLVFCSDSPGLQSAFRTHPPNGSTSIASSTFLALTHEPHVVPRRATHRTSLPLQGETSLQWRFPKSCQGGASRFPGRSPFEPTYAGGSRSGSRLGVRNSTSLPLGAG